MFDLYSIHLVKSTIPDLQDHIDDIVDKFYSSLFALYPEISTYFQQIYPQNYLQAKALVEVMTCFGCIKKQPKYLDSQINRVAVIHISLGIQPKHYDGIGHCLLEVIQECLAEKASIRVMYAWTKAYWQLADMLMAREEQLYSELTQ